MEIPFLGDVVVVFVLSVLVLYIFHKIKAPTIIGFLITGILAGPQGLGLIVDTVDILAEIGVILLLFTIGLEVSLKDLVKIKKYVLISGPLQVILTIALVYAILRLAGLPLGESILLGFLISLSSTAIVLRIIQSRSEFYSPHGRITLGILIFQDIAIVPMMLITPLLPGVTSGTVESPLIVLAKGLGLIVLVIICAKWIVPNALDRIATTGDREIFLLSIVAICFAVAWATSLAGLSLGLGAFLAGLTISESRYSHQAFGNVLPLRDAFTSFFFISIGMFLDVGYLLENPVYIVLLAVSVIILKAVIASSVIALVGLPIRTTVLVGLALSQIGEFSFVLSKVGLENGLLSNDIYQIFLDVTVLTMAATSFIIAVSHNVADAVMRLPIPVRMKSVPPPPSGKDEQSMKDHLIIVGYGVNGRNVARSARSEEIPYVIIDLDLEIVKTEVREGEPIIYGDATQDAVLLHAGIRDARVVVIAISDRVATRRVVDLAKRLSPDVYIIARTRYIQEMKPLHDMGANEVIPEEYETSIEIFSRVLEKCQVPKERIEAFTESIRSDGYDMFRRLSKEPYCSSDISQISRDIATLKVGIGSPIDGRTISDIGLKEHDITLLAIHRGSETIKEPGEDLQLHPGDMVVLLAPDTEIDDLRSLFKNVKAANG